MTYQEILDMDAHVQAVERGRKRGKEIARMVESGSLRKDAEPIQCAHPITIFLFVFATVALSILLK